VGTDSKTCFDYWTTNHVQWGTLTLVWMGMPFVVKCILFIRWCWFLDKNSNAQDDSTTKHELFKLFLHLPFLLPFRCLYLSWKLWKMGWGTNKFDHSKSKKVEDIQREAGEAGMYESYFEAGPQAVSQLVIVLSSGTITTTQIISITISILSLSWSASRAFFIQRSLKEADPDPNKLLVILRVFPWMLISVMTSLITWTCIGGIIGPFCLLLIFLSFLVNYIVLKFYNWLCPVNDEKEEKASGTDGDNFFFKAAICSAWVPSIPGKQKWTFTTSAISSITIRTVFLVTTFALAFSGQSCQFNEKPFLLSCISDQSAFQNCSNTDITLQTCSCELKNGNCFNYDDILDGTNVKNASGKNSLQQRIRICGSDAQELPIQLVLSVILFIFLLLTAFASWKLHQLEDYMYIFKISGTLLGCIPTNKIIHRGLIFSLVENNNSEELAEVLKASELLPINKDEEAEKPVIQYTDNGETSEELGRVMEESELLPKNKNEEPSSNIVLETPQELATVMQENKQLPINESEEYDEPEQKKSEKSDKVEGLDLESGDCNNEDSDKIEEVMKLLKKDRFKISVHLYQIAKPFIKPSSRFVNRYNAKGETSLHTAVGSNADKCVVPLLFGGAKLLPNTENKTPDISKLMVDNKKNTLLHQAVNDGNIDSAILLLVAGAKQFSNANETKPALSQLFLREGKPGLVCLMLTQPKIDFGLNHYMIGSMEIGKLLVEWNKEQVNCLRMDKKFEAEELINQIGGIVFNNVSIEETIKAIKNWNKDQTLSMQCYFPSYYADEVQTDRKIFEKQGPITALKIFVAKGMISLQARYADVWGILKRILIEGAIHERIEEKIFELDSDEFISSVDGLCEKTDGSLQQIKIYTSEGRCWSPFSDLESLDQVPCGSPYAEDQPGPRLKLAYLGQNNNTMLKRNSLCFLWIVEDKGPNIKVGSYENHEYDNGGKNDWHYVTITKGKDGSYKWINNAGKSWSLYVTNKKDTLTVGEDCPYHKNGYTEAVFNADGVFGPWNEFYQFEAGPNIRVGNYENNQSESVTITREDDGSYKWMNKAGVSWSLFVTNIKGTLDVDEDCPYYANGYTKAVFNAEGVFGPQNEFYQFESIVENKDILEIRDTVKIISKGEASIHRKNRMGTYIKTHQLAQGYPVFEQAIQESTVQVSTVQEGGNTNKKHFLFVGPDGAWRIGPDITSYDGSVLKHPKPRWEETPNLPPKSGWLYYLNNKWNQDDTLLAIVNVKSVTDTVEIKSKGDASPLAQVHPAIQEKDTVTIISKGDAGIHRKNRMGTYIKTSQQAQGRPVFKQAIQEVGNNEYFLFVGPDGTWRVGPDINSYSGSLLKHPKPWREETPNLPPKYGWLYYLNNKWNEDDSLQLIVNVKSVSGGGAL